MFFSLRSGLLVVMCPVFSGHINGVSVKEASEQLGVPGNVLYAWRHKHLDEMEANAPEGSPSPKALAAENAELRKQLAKQKRMTEILKKLWATSARTRNAVSIYQKPLVGLPSG
jgi:transposase-like protein